MTPSYSSVPGTATPTKQTALVTLLDQKHAYWSTNHDTWDMLDLLYRGGQAIQEQAARFLRKRPKELSEVYTARLVSFDYQGIIGTGCGWYMSKLFSKDPTIDIRPKGEQDPAKLPDAKKKPYTDFLQNCDRSNTTYIDLWRQIFENLLVFKGCYVCVDLPRLDATVTNRAQQRAAGGLDPYLTVWGPRSVINWDVDDYGNLLWAVVKVKTYRHTFLGDGLSVDRWYYYDRTDYRIYERSRVEPKDSGEVALFGASGELVSSAAQQTAELIDEGKHSMSGENRVPLRYIMIPDGLWLANRAYLPSMTHLNVENSLIWAVIMANLPVAVIKGDTEFCQTISETAYISLDKDASFEWTEPKGTSFKTSQEILKSKREEIFRSMFLIAQGRDSSASASAASGVSKEADMTPAKDVLAAFGDVIRAQGQNLLNDIALVRGDANIEFDIRGFNFEESSAIDEAEVLELLMSLDIQSDEFYKQAQIRVLQSYLTDANRAVIQQCIDEVNAAPTRSEQAAQEAQAQKLAMTAGLQKATMRISGAAQAQDGLANSS